MFKRLINDDCGTGFPEHPVTMSANCMNRPGTSVDFRTFRCSGGYGGVDPFIRINKSGYGFGPLPFKIR